VGVACERKAQVRRDAGVDPRERGTATEENGDAGESCGVGAGSLERADRETRGRKGTKKEQEKKEEKVSTIYYLNL